ncbi:hypothetical protein CK203_066117 [Vitis vinifera]|uniref:Uncharacterized protein n=1 Tax=Vitis vinifera TaxID=29760 RepID=A0A438G4A1_VITVI|nr:hypothetical protein CK203_066117 [Vitis vinifera]
MKDVESSSKANRGVKPRNRALISSQAKVYPAPAEKPLESRTALPSFRPWQDQRRPFRLPILTDTSTTSAAMGAAASPPVQAPPFPHLRGKPLLSADTPPGGHPRPVPPRATASLKRTKFSGPGEPSHAPQQSPTEEPRIPVGSPETVIRRPMIADRWIAEIDPSTPRPTLI